MNIDAVKTLCKQYPGAGERVAGAPANVHSFTVGGKPFAYFKTSQPEQWRFSIRTTPERFLELTDVPGVKPARYMGRFHWVTIVDVSSFPADYLAELIGWSYAQAVRGLPKKQQLALAAG